MSAGKLFHIILNLETFTTVKFETVKFTLTNELLNFRLYNQLILTSQYCEPWPEKNEKLSKFKVDVNFAVAGQFTLRISEIY